MTVKDFLMSPAMKPLTYGFVIILFGIIYSRFLAEPNYASLCWDTFTPFGTACFPAGVEELGTWTDHVLSGLLFAVSPIIVFESYTRIFGKGKK